MGGYGSGRPTRHMSTSDCTVISVKEAHTHNIALTYTVQSGAVPGRRAWMLCPLCNARVGKLYLSRVNPSRPACRMCLQLNYDCQRLPKEEKQRTYERWLLEQGYYWAFHKWATMEKHYLTYEEANCYMLRGQCRRTSEFMKLAVETIRLFTTMEKNERKRERYEKRALELEKRAKKYRKKKATIHQIHMDMHVTRKFSHELAA